MEETYPWSFLLRWPLHLAWPSTRKRGRWTPEPPHRDFEAADDPLRLLFCGDLMVTRDGRVPSISPPVTRLVQGADLLVGNCEAPVAAECRCDGLVFAMSEEYLLGLLEALGARPRDCVLSVANNHCGDAGPGGVAESLRRLGALGITTVGAPGPVKCARRGVALGFWAWTRWLNRKADGVGRAPPAVAPEEAPDCRVAFPHWDYEFCHFPRGETLDLAVRLMDGGFDLVVGHHPHVLQPVMRHGAKLCLFSTGNVNGPYFPFMGWPMRLGCLFEVRLVRSGPRRGKIAGYTVHPLVQEQRGRRTHVTTLEETRPSLRARCEDRFGLVFPA